MASQRVCAGMVSAALILLLGLGACSTSDDPPVGTGTPSADRSNANARPSVDPTTLPPEWPAEAPQPQGMAIVDVKTNDAGTTVLGNASGADAIAAGEAMRATWEDNGVLVTSSDDSNKTYYLSALSKDRKTQLTATIAGGGAEPLQIILTMAPANQ